MVSPDGNDGSENAEFRVFSEGGEMTGGSDVRTGVKVARKCSLPSSHVHPPHMCITFTRCTNALGSKERGKERKLAIMNALFQVGR